jgi:hypothetical protein
MTITNDEPDHLGNFPEALLAPGRKIFRSRRKNLGAGRLEIFRSRPKTLATGRRYRLSAEGLAAKRIAIRLCEPWMHSTGPRTAEGKARSAANGLRNRDLWRIVSRRVVDDDDKFGIVSTREIHTRYVNGRTSVRRSTRLHFRRLQVRRRRLTLIFEKATRRQDKRGLQR